MKRPLLKKIAFCFGLLAFLSLILTYPLSWAQISPKKETMKKVKYTSGRLRDPFRSTFETEGVAPVPRVEYGLSHLAVQGMVWNSEMPQAIINNTVVKVGEIIEGAEILEIQKEGICVLYEGQQYILRSTIQRR